MKQIEPDIIADITLYPTNRGGREAAIRGGYSCVCLLEGTDRGCHILLHGRAVAPGETARVGVTILLGEEEAATLFFPARRFFLWEGRIVGEGTVISNRPTATKVYIKKEAAIQRQLDAAIRWLFEGEDLLPVHTVVAAAYGISSDLAKNRGLRLTDNLRDQSAIDTFRKLLGRIPSNEEIRPMITQWKQTERRPANFLKHADRDPTGVLDADAIDTDHLLLMACVSYIELGFELTPEMSAFVKWHCAVYPSEGDDVLNTGAGPLHTLDRRYQLECGAIILRIYRGEPASD
jgi:hypothetical protein